MLFDTCRVECADTPIRFVVLYPGFTYTDGMDADEVPFEWPIIQHERATDEMNRVLGRDKGHHVFPRRIAFARLPPEPERRWLLGRFA